MRKRWEGNGREWTGIAWNSLDTALCICGTAENSVVEKAEYSRGKVLHTAKTYLCRAGVLWVVGCARKLLNHLHKPLHRDCVFNYVGLQPNRNPDPASIEDFIPIRISMYFYWSSLTLLGVRIPTNPFHHKSIPGSTSCSFSSLL